MPAVDPLTRRSDRGPAGEDGGSVADLRVRTFWTGIWGTLVVVVAVATYALTTWGEPGRGVLLGVSVLATVGSLALWWPLPVRRWVTGPRRHLFNACWTTTLVLALAVVALADGGATSPVLAALLVTQTYAALVYPLRHTVGIAALELLVVVVVTMLSPVADRPDGLALAGILLAAALIPAWHARAQRLRRADLDRLTRVDALTGALNVRGFDAALRRAVERVDAGHGRAMLVTADLDAFKLVNDTRGHVAGDELLAWVARTLAVGAGPVHAVGRVGGDEFAVVLDPGDRDAQTIVGALRLALAERTRASLGAAVCPDEGRDPVALRELADSRLYAEKRAGGSTPVGDRRATSWAAALAETVDARMGVPHEHSRRVATFAVGIGERLGWGREQRAALQVAALLHDVGKVRVPEMILRKPGPLTAAEFEEIAEHPVSGADIAGLIEGLEPIVPWIRHSHEHWDGSGYPDGLAADAIPPASRILLVADAYDAMTSDRPYRAGMPVADAVAELHRHAGRQFDPTCVDALVAQLVAAGEVDADADHVPGGLPPVVTGRAPAA